MHRFEILLSIVLALTCSAAGAKGRAPPVVDRMEWITGTDTIHHGVRQSGVQDLSARCNGRKVAFETLSGAVGKPAKAGGLDGRRVGSSDVREDFEGNVRATFLSTMGDPLHAAAAESSWIEISGEGWSYRIEDVPNAAFAKLYAKCAKRREKS